MEPTDLEARLRRELSSIRTQPATPDEWAMVQKRRSRRAVSTPLVIGALTIAVLVVAALALVPKGTRTKLVATPTATEAEMPQLPPPTPPAHVAVIALAARLPAEGVIVAEKGGLKLLTLNGAVLERLDGMHVVAPFELPPGPVVLERSSDRARFVLEGGADRLRSWDGGWPLAYGALLTVPDEASAKEHDIGPEYRIFRSGRMVLRIPKNARSELEMSRHRDMFSVVPYGTHNPDQLFEYRPGAYAVDVRDGRRRPLRDGCRVVDRRSGSLLLLCGSAGSATSIEVLDPHGARRVVAKTPPEDRPPSDGVWRDAAWSPDGSEIGATWSGQCESPSAWRMSDDGSVRRGFDGATSYGDVNESFFLTWTRSGEALVLFTDGACGPRFHGGPGIYRIAQDGGASKIPGTTTPDGADYYSVTMWGPVR